MRNGKEASFYINLACYILSFPILALIISMFGTTPGKFLYGISVKKSNGTNLNISEAFSREKDVLIFGVLFGLFPFSIITYVKSYNDLNKNKITSWDKKLNVAITHTEDWSTQKYLIIGAITFFILKLLQFQNVMI
jgi:hypothetical protein